MNDRQQLGMSRKVTILLSALLFVLCLTGAKCGGSSSSRTDVDSGGKSTGVKVIAGSGTNGWQLSFPPSNEKGELFTLINRQRTNIGLPALIWHHGAASVAQRHADDMVNRGYFAATSPDGIGIDNRLVSSSPRIDFTSWAAIVTQGSTSPQDIFESDVESFRLIVESQTFTHIGIGFNLNGNGTWTEVYLQNPVP